MLTVVTEIGNTLLIFLLQDQHKLWNGIRTREKILNNFKTIVTFEDIIRAQNETSNLILTL